MDIETFSPKEVAEIIGVSESTVKRWVDAGFIQVHRTKGGHRRVARAEIIQFARREGMPILRPDLLGSPVPAIGRGLTADAFFDFLSDGDGPSVRRSLVAAYSAGRSVAELVDDVIAPAFDRLGDLWNHGEEGIFVEHRALTLCIEAIHQVRLLMPDRNGRTPVIVGGAPSGDSYVLPSLAVSVALRDAGMLTVHLGAESPVSTFMHAVHVHGPKLIWVSMTTRQRVGVLQAFINDLAAESGLPIVVGGQASTSLPRDQRPNVVLLSTMRELVSYAREVVSA